MILSTNQRGVILDSIMYSALFYILANKNMYGLTSKILPIMKDRVLLHGIVFSIIYIIIQKLIKRF
jgi:hypothetical protein